MANLVEQGMDPKLLWADWWELEALELLEIDEIEGTLSGDAVRRVLAHVKYILDRTGFEDVETYIDFEPRNKWCWTPIHETDITHGIPCIVCCKKEGHVNVEVS